MPQNRPRIPADIERQVLIEAGHRCAVCGSELPLERAHIIAWSRSKDHSAANLLCLCANCHGRADSEDWGEAILRQYKQQPWVIRARGHQLPSPSVDFIGESGTSDGPKEIGEIALGQRSIQIGRDANGNVLLTGGRNFVLVVQTGRILEPAERVSPPAANFGPNPYKGLAAFREEDADRFFGRERLTQNLWKAFRDLQKNPEAEEAVRLLAVLGPSGSGKSSLVRAGLFPELARQPLTGLEDLRVAIVAPGAHPVDALALVLARLVTGDSAPVAKAREFSEELGRCNPSGELDGLRRIAGDKPLLVFIDQFEEVYTLASATEREIFIGNLLHAAADRGGGVSVVLTLRTDFLPQSQENERLHEIIARQNLVIPFLSEDGLRRAIAEPARRAGQPLDEGTIELLVQETRGREGALPVLQFTLSRIWQGMARGVPAAQTYKEVGGVGGSLAQEAQKILDSLGEEDRAIARRAFLRMVRVGHDIRDTSRKVDLDEIVAHSEDREHVKAVLERFAKPEARIITLAAEPDSTITARLTHETLLDRWKQLEEWLTPQAREDLLFHYRLEEEARYWDRRGRSVGLLWPRHDLGRLLAYAQRAGQDMTTVQRAFFETVDSKGLNLKRVGRRVALWRRAAPWSLAAILALAALGLWRISQDTIQELSSPSAVTILDLPPRLRGGSEPKIELPANVALRVSMHGIPEHPSYFFDIVSLNGGQPIWSGQVQPSEDGLFLLYPSLSPGEYRLILSGGTSSRSFTLATYILLAAPDSKNPPPLLTN